MKKQKPKHAEVTDTINHQDLFNARERVFGVTSQVTERCLGVTSPVVTGLVAIQIPASTGLKSRHKVTVWRQ